jgi:hypothetical protein
MYQEATQPYYAPLAPLLRMVDSTAARPQDPAVASSTTLRNPIGPM